MGAAIVYSGVLSFVLLKLIGFITSLRTSERDESIGLDVMQHGEEAYVTGEGAILVDPDGERDRGAFVANPA